MLRAINTDTTHRRPAMQAHRARPASMGAELRGERSDKEVKIMKNEETERMAYIEFITRMLTERADLRLVRIVYEFVLRLID